jgi:hypothetical protein
VRDPAKPAAIFAPPRVTFYADLSRNVAAVVLDVRLPPDQGDLAVLVVPKVPIPPPQPAVMAGTQALEPGMATWQLGLRGVWMQPSASARYALREPAGWLNFDGLDGSPGSAGGAVITELGLAGMVVGSDPGANRPARVLPAELIAAKFREWGLAWNILPPGAAAPAGTGSVATNATPVQPAPPNPPAAPTEAPSSPFGSINVVALLPAELAARGSWVPPDARVSPWARSGAVLLGAPRKDANRVGELPAGYLLPQDLWSRGAYPIENRIDKGAWFLLGTPGEPLGYVAGTDVVEVWPAAKPDAPAEGKVVREIPLQGGKAVLRDAGTHYDLTVSLTCELAVCDSILFFTPIPPSPGAIVPTFQVPRIAGSWQQHDTAEAHVLLPRSLVETKGAQLIACFGLDTACRQQRLSLGG